MPTKLMDRFRSWVCSKIGHRRDASRTWWHLGSLWTVCPRCKHIVSHK